MHDWSEIWTRDLIFKMFLATLMSYIFLIRNDTFIDYIKKDTIRGLSTAKESTNIKNPNKHI